jgi:hypothetical protein
MSKSLTRSDHVFAEMCRRELSEEGRHLWREHHKVTMIASAIISPISASLVVGLAHWLWRFPMSWGSVSVTLGAGAATFVFLILIVYGYFRLIAAPRSLY